MFDSPENRFRYESFKARHSEMMVEKSSDGEWYRAGFLHGGSEVGHAHLMNYEAWRAGRDNSMKSKPR